MDEEADVKTAQPGSVLPGAEADHGRYDGNKPLEQIEVEIAHTRVRLAAAIEALLEEGLAPHRVIENGAEVLRDALEPHSGSLRDQIRAFAIPLALIASGLGWLFVLRRRHWTSSLAGETPEVAVETSEVPDPAAAYTDVAEPVEAVPLAEDSRTQDLD